jgi:hypothetical protein
MASANDPFERGFRITQYKIAKTTFWRPIGAPGIFGFDDVYGDTIDAIQEVRDLGYLGSQQSLHLEMPSGTHGTSDRIPWYHLEPINRTTWRARTVSTYKTAAEKAQEHWELVERLRVKARLAESDVLWTAAEAERLIAKRAMIAAEKRRARRAKKQKVEREQRALQVEQLARDQRERDAQQELAQAKQRRADAEQRATAARAELAKAQANPPKPAPAIVPATTIPKSTVDYDRDFDIPCDLLFPQWQDARVHLARFLAVGEPWTWEAFLMADGRTFIALSNKHFIFDQSQRAFNCGMVVPPGSTWVMFLKRYRLGLGTYLNFKRPRYPERRAEYENQPYTIIERQAWQMECVAAVRLRESQLVAQGWPSARVSLARAFGIRYDGR